MRFRELRRLLDLPLALLCLWAAAYHTPAGALARRAGARILGQKSSAPPLLAFYSGGEPEVARTWATPPVPVFPPDRGESVPVRLALGYGVHAALMQMDPAERGPVRELARRYNVEPGALEHPETGPREVARLLDALSERFRSDDAAVLALLCGEEPARYAQERALAEGAPAELEPLSRSLPPRFEAQVHQAERALALGIAYGLSWPVSEATRISSPFGMRHHPILGSAQMHTGVDIPVPEGTLVHAAAAGVVRRAGEDALNGRVLIIDHGHGVRTAYCHNSKLEVVVGQRVERGQAISLSGNTGRSTGPHLHFQLELSGTPVDPLRYRPGGPAVAEGGGL